MTDLLRTNRPASADTGNAFIKTTRLLLRPPLAEDAPAIAAIANDRRIAENTARLPHPYALADAQQFIAFINGTDQEVAFVIALPDGRIIGVCGTGMTGGKSPEIGYWLGVSHWGNGYATEAARALIKYAFTKLHHDKLEAQARVSNPASRRVLEKCGFQWTGVVLRRSRVIRSHVPVDRFQLDRSRWIAARQGEGAQMDLSQETDVVACVP